MIRWLIAFLAFFSAAPLAADELRPAVVELTELSAGEWRLDWKVPVAASAGRSARNLPQPVIPQNCRMASEPVQRAGPATLYGSVLLDCDGSLTDQQFGLTQLFGRADALARFIPLEGGVQTFRLTGAEPTATIAAAPDLWQVARDYLIIGTEHILLGLDHLLFVIALVLLVQSRWAVVKAATAFTIAHSITLVATTLGYAGLPSRPVEALIALSIVFLAVELAQRLRDPTHETWTRRAPWIVAFAFGLLHGFGFAGALADIGLPQGEIAAALIAFNLGVEAGQLLIVAAVLSVLWAIRRVLPTIETRTLRAITYLIGITGSFWVYERVVL